MKRSWRFNWGDIHIISGGFGLFIGWENYNSFIDTPTKPLRGHNMKIYIGPILINMLWYTKRGKYE